MRICYDNFIDIASNVTALTANTQYPASQLQEQRLAATYRSTSPTTQTITINLGSARAISVGAVLGHNLTSSATITMSLNSSDSWPGATTKTIVHNAGIALTFFTPETYQYVQFAIDDSDNTDGYLEIGRVWVGDYIDIDPSSLLDFTVTKRRSDNVIHGKNRQKYASIGSGWRAFDLSFPPSSNTMVNKILTWYDYSGTHSSFIFCNFDSIRTYEIVEPCYCSLSDDLTFTHSDLMKFSYNLQMEEEK